MLRSKNRPLRLQRSNNKLDGTEWDEFLTAHRTSKCSKRIGYHYSGKIGKRWSRGRDILDEIGAYQTEGSNWNIAGSRSRPCSRLVSLEMVPSGRNREAKPSTAHPPISVFPRRPPALPTPPLDPATSNKPPPPSLRSLIRRPFRYHPAAILYRREESLSTRRREESKFLSSSWNEVQIRYSRRSTMVHSLGKYDSVISYSLCRNRLRRTICELWCPLFVHWKERFPEGMMIPKRIQQLYDVKFSAFDESDTCCLKTLIYYRVSHSFEQCSNFCIILNIFIYNIYIYVILYSNLYIILNVYRVLISQSPDFVTNIENKKCSKIFQHTFYA